MNGSAPVQWGLYNPDPELRLRLTNAPGSLISGVCRSVPAIVRVGESAASTWWVGADGQLSLVMFSVVRPTGRAALRRHRRTIRRRARAIIRSGRRSHAR